VVVHVKPVCIQQRMHGTVWTYAGILEDVQKLWKRSSNDPETISKNGMAADQALLATSSHTPIENASAFAGTIASRRSSAESGSDSPR
jgi:phage-related baseplate assembly protein